MRSSIDVRWVAAVLVFATTSAAAGTSSWVPAGSLASARASHAATLLRDGRVLVSGGYGATSLSSAELFDPATGTWRSTAALGVPRTGHATVLLANGKVLAVGGEGLAGVAKGSTEIYDPATEAWTPAASLRTPRVANTTTLLANGKVLVTGGVDNGDTALVTSELYDPATDTWQNTGSLRFARFAHVAVRLADGQVLVAGGSDDDFFQGVVASAELYDPGTGSWRPVGDISVARQYVAGTLLQDGKVLLTGGYSSLAPPGGGNYTPRSYATTELFDPATGWSTTASLSVPRMAHTATLLSNGDVLVAGGYDWNERRDLDSAEEYGVAARSWNLTDPMSTTRAHHTATRLADGRVLVAGGVVVGRDYSNRAVATAELHGAVTVPQVTIDAGFTGAWYDPAQSGHGLFIEILPENRMLAAWFTFAPNGEQSWFVGVGSYAGNAATVTAVDQPTGGRWIPNFDTGKIVHNAWGTLVLTFIDCNHGRVDFSSTKPGYGSGTMSLTRLTQPAGLTCQ